MLRTPIALAAAALALALAAPAQATKTCSEPEPGAPGWQKATPAEVGMDQAKLQEAVDYGTTQASAAVRVYRHGCLVAADRLQAANSQTRFESFSKAKSITALVFGRAMTLGLISPHDPIGSLVTEADQPHGKILMRHFLEMTSGLHWNGFRDYNVFMQDRLHDFLTVGIDHEPGTWYEYSQTGPAMVAEAVTRAVGEDFQAFAQRELFTPLGILPGTWTWSRDKAGRTNGYYGVNMTPDDFARFGDLMRRGGVWKGQRLLSKEFVRKAVAPSRTNGCYGWLIWVNKAKPCIGATVDERPVRDRREFPSMPRDLYNFSGLFGQIVAVFPTQGIVVERNGQDPGVLPADGPGWEETLYQKVLAAVTDQQIVPPDDADDPKVPGDNGQPNPDNGFQHSWDNPEQYTAPAAGGPVPPAGPFRQRALQLGPVPSVGKRGRGVRVRATCPPKASRPCAGRARLTGARRAVRYSVRAGTWKRLRFTMRRPVRKVRRATVRAVNRDGAGGAASARIVRLRPR